MHNNGCYLGSMDTSFGVLYRCCIRDIPVLYLQCLCYNLLESAWIAVLYMYLCLCFLGCYSNLCIRLANSWTTKFCCVLQIANSLIFYHILTRLQLRFRFDANYIDKGTQCRLVALNQIKFLFYVVCYGGHV